MQLCSLLSPLAEQRLRVVLAGALLLDGSLCAVSAAVRGRGGEPAASRVRARARGRRAQREPVPRGVREPLAACGRLEPGAAADARGSLAPS